MFLKVDDKNRFIACTKVLFSVFKMYSEHCSQFLWNYFEQLISALISTQLHNPQSCQHLAVGKPYCTRLYVGGNFHTHLFLLHYVVWDLSSYSNVLSKYSSNYAQIDSLRGVLKKNKCNFLHFTLFYIRNTYETFSLLRVELNNESLYFSQNESDVVSYIWHWYWFYLSLRI